jgi:ferrous iron transport protein A
MIQRIPLTGMKAGETGKVVDVLGGRGVHNRLRSLGIRNGAKVTKVSGAFARGPVVLRIGGAQVVLGFGVAHRVAVEVDR